MLNYCVVSDPDGVYDVMREQTVFSMRDLRLGAAEMAFLALSRACIDCSATEEASSEGQMS